MKPDAVLPVSTKKKLSPRFAFAMQFHIIVTFHHSIRTLTAIEAMEQEFVFNDIQIMFDYGISIRSTSSYDSLMRRLRKAVITHTTKLCGLGEGDISKISTCGNWTLWEQVTGLSEEIESAHSTIARNGKFYF